MSHLHEVQINTWARAKKCFSSVITDDAEVMCSEDTERIQQFTKLKMIYWISRLIHGIANIC